LKAFYVHCSGDAAAVEEIFDVQLLAGARFPEVMGFHKDTVHHAFVIPPQ
jgi:hypothetical protein